MSCLFDYLLDLGAWVFEVQDFGLQVSIDESSLLELLAESKASIVFVVLHLGRVAVHIEADVPFLQASGDVMGNEVDAVLLLVVELGVRVNLLHVWSLVPDI